MKHRSLLFILILTLIIGTIPTGVMAAYTPPKTFGAPQDFSVQFREDGYEKTWIGFEATVSASEELRTFVDEVGADNSPFAAAGYYLSAVKLQFDYRRDSGAWHFKNQWNQSLDSASNMSEIRIEKGTYFNYAIFDKGQFESISEGGALPADKAYFDTHSMDFRVRFVVTYQDKDGKYYNYASPWSKTVTFSNNQKAEDPDALINHAPVLKSAEVKKFDGTPYLRILSEKPHEDLKTLNSISGNSVKTEVWVKSGAGDWELIHSDNFVEQFDANVLAYFGLKDSYDAVAYDAKVRYSFDYNFYPAAGKSGVIYSPYSNVISHGTPAYSNASAWAKNELDKADSYGLIPESLKGADMTRPITREEFAETAMLLYEKATGKSATPVSPNPFIDTDNPQILKAFKLGIVKGISADEFAPNDLTNREQVATMLSNAIRVIAPNSDFSTKGAPVFNDQEYISNWALNHCLYMAKLGIIAGADGNFMPKATTSAQIAEGYATTTREQALAMSKRSYEKMSDIKASKAEVSSASPSSSGTKTPNSNTLASDAALVGKWEYSASAGNVGIYISVELNSDGTFFKVIGTSTSFSVSGTSLEGNYKISGNKIIYYNQKKGTGTGSSLTNMIFNPKIENIPAEDKEEAYVLSDNSHLRLGDTDFTRKE